MRWRAWSRQGRGKGRRTRRAYTCEFKAWVVWRLMQDEGRPSPRWRGIDSAELLVRGN